MMSKSETLNATSPGLALGDADLNEISAGFDPDAYRKMLMSYRDDVLAYTYHTTEENLRNSRDFLADRFPEGNPDLERCIAEYQQKFELMKDEMMRRSRLK